MPTELDISLLPDIRELINDLGRPAHIVYQAGANFDQKTNQLTGGIEKAVACKLTPPAPFDRGWLPQSTVPVSRLMVLVSAPALGGFIPVKGMLIQYGRGSSSPETFGITSVHPIYSGELPCVYVLGVEA